MSATSSAMPLGSGAPDEVAGVERKLTSEFNASVPPEQVQRCIADVAAQFDVVRVRTFVPLLVERMARERLRDAHHEVDNVRCLGSVPPASDTR